MLVRKPLDFPFIVHLSGSLLLRSASRHDLHRSTVDTRDCSRDALLLGLVVFLCTFVRWKFSVDECYITFDPWTWTWNFASTPCGMVGRLIAIHPSVAKRDPVCKYRLASVHSPLTRLRHRDQKNQDDTSLQMISIYFDFYTGLAVMGLMIVLDTTTLIALRAHHIVSSQFIPVIIRASQRRENH